VNLLLFKKWVWDGARVLIFLVLFTLFYITVSLFFKSPTIHPDSYVNNNNNVFGLNIPFDLTFCGEKAPNDNYEISQNLQKELFSGSHWKRNYAHLYERACRWFPYIEPILKEEGLPDDIKYIAVIESHLTNTFSRAGAAGFWQLVPSTAISCGLEVNDLVDERMDVEKSTRAACKLMKTAYKRFQNWTLAAVAYNRGIGGIETAMAEQEAETFYDLKLNKESGEFVYRLMAYKTLLSNPSHFNINFKAIKNYSKMPVKYVKIDTAVNYPVRLAEHLGLTMQELMQLNPWLVIGKLKPSEGQVFKIAIPKNPKKNYTPYYTDLRPGYTPPVQEVVLVEIPDSVKRTTTGDKLNNRMRLKK